MLSLGALALGLLTALVLATGGPFKGSAGKAVWTILMDATLSAIVASIASSKGASTEARCLLPVEATHLLAVEAGLGAIPDVEP